MSFSGIICTIKLDPFYQAFLCRQFGYIETAPVFAFPKGHDLSLRFQFYLSVPPRNYQTPDYGDWTFKIEIPFMEHKSANYYRFMSQKQQANFQARIRAFWKDVSHEIIGKEKRAGFLKEEIIQKLMEDFGFEENYRDRIRRDYSRYLQSERNRRYNLQSRELKNVKSPQLSD